jgi:hypothetical protein
MLYVTAETNAAHVNKREYSENQDLYSPHFSVGYAINGQQTP